MLHTKVSPHSSPSVVVLQEVLSAVIIIKLLSCCRLPERCSKSLWLFAPQILSTMVVRKANNTQKQSYTVFFVICCFLYPETNYLVQPDNAQFSSDCLFGGVLNYLQFNELFKTVISDFGTY